MNSESATSSHAQREEILNRTFGGAKWMLYLSASALIAGFCTNVILGRVGPEALGFYSLLMLIVSMIQTFFVFGASNVLVNYFPQLSAEQKPRFVFTYTIIVYLAAALFLTVCLSFPAIMNLVFRSVLHIPIGIYVAILAPILLAQVLVWAMLQAELEGAKLAVSMNAVSWFYFVTIGLLGVMGILGATSGNGPTIYVFAAVVLANCSALGISVYYLKRTHPGILCGARHWFLPEGFWRFTLGLHFGTLFSFMISNAAPIFILRELGLKELGYFRAASVFAAFVSWVPSVFDKSFYPSFCNLVGRNLPTDEVYGRFSRLNAISSSTVALVIILFTRELLSVFGKDFSDSAYFLLLMLSAGYLISTPFMQINFALVTAHLRTQYTMGAYAIGAASGIVLYSELVPRFGLPGIAAAFISLQLIMLSLSFLLTSRFTHAPFPARAYLIALCALGIGGLGAYYFGPVSIPNTAIKFTLFGLFFILLIVTKLLTETEIKEIFAAVLPQNVTGEQ